MSRPIRFVGTRWGQVAYSVVGDGPPLVFDTGWVGDLEVMWRHAGYRAFVQRLAASHAVICFDPVGTGLSDRSGSTESLDEETEILGLVLAAARVRTDARVSLFCSSIAASTAVRFAAQRPALVDRLILFGATLRGGDLGSPDARLALGEFVRGHWGLGSQAIVDVFVPDVDAEDREWFHALQRACTDGETAARRLEMYYESDVTSDATLVTARTLVLHREADRAVQLGLGRAVAAAIEGAIFEVVDGPQHLCFMGDWEQIADLAVPFLEAAGPGALPKGPFGAFTARETDVAELTVHGLSNAAIGERLGISARTVETHLTRIRQKLGVHTRAEVAAWMARRAEVG